MKPLDRRATGMPTQLLSPNPEEVKGWELKRARDDAQKMTAWSSSLDSLSHFIHRKSRIAPDLKVVRAIGFFFVEFCGWSFEFGVLGFAFWVLRFA